MSWAKRTVCGTCSVGFKGNLSLLEILFSCPGKMANGLFAVETHGHVANMIAQTHVLWRSTAFLVGFLHVVFLEPPKLDCYWVRSLDFNFWEIKGGSTKPTKSDKLFAEGSAAQWVFSRETLSKSRRKGKFQ